MVICLERGAGLHMAHPMPLPLTVSCFSKIQICFTFLVLAHLGSFRQRVVKWVCVCMSLLKKLVFSEADCSDTVAAVCCLSVHASGQFHIIDQVLRQVPVRVGRVCLPHSSDSLTVHYSGENTGCDLGLRRLFCDQYRPICHFCLACTNIIFVNYT